MSSWEYLTITAVRGMNFWGRPKPWSRDVPAELADLGRQGWELVSVAPHSSMGGVSSSGYTSEEIWVFKRPLQRK